MDMMLAKGIEIPEFKKTLKYSIRFSINEELTVEFIQGLIDYKNRELSPSGFEALEGMVGQCKGENYNDFHNNKKTGGI
jgi:hypothetical protein